MSDRSLIWTLLKNVCAEGVNREKIGYCVTDRVPPIPPEEAAAFGAATGDPNPDYASAGGPLPPLFIARLVIPALRRIMCLPDLHLNLLRTVHAEQSVRWHRTLYNGEALRLEMILTDIRDTDAGELLRVTGRCMAGGKTAVEGVTGLLVRSKKRGKSKPTHSEAAGEPAPVRFRIGIDTWEGQQLQYAQVSGDRNLIHTSEIMAKAAGLSRTILHGACVLAMANAALTRALADGDIDRIERIACRFSRPVIPGKPLSLVVGKGADPHRVPFTVLDDTGRPAIKHGLFCYR